MATPNPNAVIIRPPQGLTVRPEARLYRLGGIVLSLLDRAGLPAARFTRIVIYRQRLVVFHLPVAYREVFGLNLAERLQQHTGLTACLVGHAAGCALVIDLQSTHSTGAQHDETTTTQPFARTAQRRDAHLAAHRDRREVARSEEVVPTERDRDLGHRYEHGGSARDRCAINSFRRRST